MSAPVFRRRRCAPCSRAARYARCWSSGKLKNGVWRFAWAALVHVCCRCARGAPGQLDRGTGPRWRAPEAFAIFRGFISWPLLRPIAKGRYELETPALNRPPSLPRFYGLIVVAYLFRRYVQRVIPDAKKAALNTRAAALLSSKLGKPSETRGGNCRPTPGGDYYIVLRVKPLPASLGNDLEFSQKTVCSAGSPAWPGPAPWRCPASQGWFCSTVFPEACGRENS